MDELLLLPIPRHCVKYMVPMLKPIMVISEPQPPASWVGVWTLRGARLDPLDAGLETGRLAKTCAKAQQRPKSVAFVSQRVAGSFEILP